MNTIKVKNECVKMKRNMRRNTEHIKLKKRVRYTMLNAMTV